MILQITTEADTEKELVSRLEAVINSIYMGDLEEAEEFMDGSYRIDGITWIEILDHELQTK